MFTLLLSLEKLAQKISACQRMFTLLLRLEKLAQDKWLSIFLTHKANALNIDSPHGHNGCVANAARTRFPAPPSHHYVCRYRSSTGYGRAHTKAKMTALSPTKASMTTEHHGIPRLCAA